MRARLGGLSAALLLSLATRGAGQGQDFSKVEIKATPVAGSVYMLEGAGGNIGVSVGNDGILIVDDQFAPLADKIRKALAELGKGRLAFILNTHWHGDHTGGNAVLGAEAPIVAHANVRKRLASGLESRGVAPAPAAALPVITFDAALSIHFNDEEIRVVHFPDGHTDGDSVIYFEKSRVVHMGDHFFAGRFPFVDLDSGGTLAGYTRNVAEVLAKLPDGAKIIPGHGPLSGRQDLELFLRMLRETTEHVSKRMDAGLELAAIQREGLGDEWKTWGAGFISSDRWIETIHKSLKR